MLQKLRANFPYGWTWKSDCTTFLFVYTHFSRFPSTQKPYLPTFICCHQNRPLPVGKQTCMYQLFAIWNWEMHFDAVSRDQTAMAPPPSTAIRHPRETTSLSPQLSNSDSKITNCYNLAKTPPTFLIVMLLTKRRKKTSRSK